MVHFEVTIEDPTAAHQLLDVAQAFAHSMDRRAYADRIARLIADPPLFG